MAALPYMQLYVADYLADTSHLNASQHGAYLLLLMNYWQRGKCIPDSNDRLAIVARMSNDEWTANRNVLAEFFEIDEEGWHHDRVERDLVKVKGISNAGKAGGEASARARKEKTLNGRSTVVTTERQRNVNHTDTDTDTDKKKIKAFIAPVELPVWLSREVWDEFVASRKALKKPFPTLHAQELAIKSLVKHREAGYDTTAIIEKSIERGWMGFVVNEETPKLKKVWTVMTPEESRASFLDGVQL